MIVSQLSLTDFRNYEAVEVGLREGSNLLIGSNGQGKTNLIEALGYLSTLRSHRTSIEQAMIRQGGENATIRAIVRHGARQILVEAQLNRGKPNRAQVNRAQVKLRELPRYFSSVLFAPEDLALIRGEPSGRRRFMDELLVLKTPRLFGVLADYDRVLRQRNTLLKSARTAGVKGSGLGTLDIWDDRLVTLGSEVIEARSALLFDLLPRIQAAYEAVAGAGHQVNATSYLTVYSSNPEAESSIQGASDPGDPAVRAGRITANEVAESFRAALARLRRKEIERGVTLVGPHRDDLNLWLNLMPARGYASHGESWSLALALKIASAEVLRADSTTGDPVLILDDVFAELDESRRTRLASMIGGFEQILVTAAVYDDVPTELAAHTVKVSGGEISEMR